MRSLETGRVGVDHRLSLGDLSFLACLLDNLDQIIADRLGKAGGVNGDHLGIVKSEDVVDRLQQIGLAAENGSPFRKGTGRGHDGVPVMPCKGAPMVGAASLRSVTVRQATVDSQRRVHSPHRLAGFRRIDCQCLPFHRLFRCVS
ncbi:MAG: hypothetical protein A4E66_02425 [Syntrophus sp. PtaB.Bin001]|nr:MAG: hypothetical protein A4E66_02425 [Syntrophus sp. PtaB.Bin001]